MIRLDNIQYANDITYIFLGYGIAQKLPATFKAIEYDSLEPYLKDIYMEDLYKSMGC